MHLTLTIILALAFAELNAYVVAAPSQNNGQRVHVLQESLVRSRTIDSNDINSQLDSVGSPLSNSESFQPLPTEQIQAEIPADDTKVKFTPGLPIPEKCNHAKFVLKNPSDIQHISDCEVVGGDLEIYEYKHPLLSLGSIGTILGSITIKKSPELVRIEAPNLSSIQKSFILRELTSLSLVSFPSLTSVKALDWRVLPILSNVHFSNEIKSIESITVSDTSLTGFSIFSADKLENLDINNNRFLDSITCNVEIIEGSLHIAANAADVVVKLPKLKSAYNMSIHDVSQIELNALEVVEGSVSMVNNRFTHIKLPKLKSVGGTLSLLKNDHLTHPEFPILNEIGGGLMIVNNTNIDKINFFPKLHVIGGALQLVGPIKDTNLKQLKLVKGSANVKSLSSTFDCNKWSRGEISTVIRGGKIECINSNNEKIVSNTPTEYGSTDNYSNGKSTDINNSNDYNNVNDSNGKTMREPLPYGISYNSGTSTIGVANISVVVMFILISLSSI